MSDFQITPVGEVIVTVALGATVGAGINAVRGRNPFDGAKTGAFVGGGVAGALLIFASWVAKGLFPTKTGGA